MTRAYRCRWLALLILFVFLPPGKPQTVGKPLSEAAILDLLQNYVPPARVAELATRKGVDFTLSPDEEKELRNAGADAALIATLRALAPAVAPVNLPKEPPKPSGPLAGDLKINPKDDERYAWIPPGTFPMGCSADDTECYDDEKPSHAIRITKGFWFGQTPVTVGAWKRYRAATGAPALPTVDSVNRTNWNEAGSDNKPAVLLTWDEANSFCQWAGMRLPTETEWEYAARAGIAASRYGDLNSIAWYANNSGNMAIDSAAF